jgi:hypothetical protein
MENQCRFCLEYSDSKENPLITPCNCNGSIRFVHHSCLLMWKNTTRNRHYQVFCSLCDTKLMYPRKWRLQTIPVEHFILSRFYVVSFLVHWCYLLLNPFYNESIVVILLLTFLIYVVYYYLLYTKLTEKEIYIHYLFHKQLPIPNIRTTIIMVLGSGILVFIEPIFFGHFLILFLSLIPRTHNDVLQLMNEQGDF